MARIKVIWGPHSTVEREFGTVWCFSGIRGNGTTCRWRLTFFYDSRKFRTTAVNGPESREVKRVQDQLDLLPEVARAVTMEGPVTPMLRARLKPEHIARATLLAMQHRKQK